MLDMADNSLSALVDMYVLDGDLLLTGLAPMAI
jgi:hypothetical protein